MQNTVQNTATNDDREAGMMTTSGVQGVGKTYQNMWLIARYVQDKIATKVKGRKVLIFDTNGEYTDAEFAKNGIVGMKTKLIALKDVEAFAYSDLVEVRRIDGKHLSIREKKAVLEHILSKFRNGMVVIEDVNTYILSVTHMEEIVGRIVNLRHRAADVLISYQSLRPVEPRIWQNSRYVRLHFQADDIADIKNKVTNPELFKIAQILVNFRYFNGDERFFVYITKFGYKIEGNFKKSEFLEACRKYLNMNKKKIKEYAQINECSEEEAIVKQSELYYRMYYDNPDVEVIKNK